MPRQRRPNRRAGSGAGGSGAIFNPSSVPGLVAWFDGRRAAYSDAAGTVIVSAFRAPVRRVNEALPLAGNWTAVDDAHRPFHDTYGIRNYIGAPTSLARSAITAVSTQNSTLAISFVNRGTFYATQGLVGCFATAGCYGLNIYQNLLLVLSTSGIYEITAIPILPSVKYTVVVRYVGGTLRIRVIANGVATDYLPGFTYSAATTNSVLQIGHSILSSGSYLSVGQVAQYSRSISDQECAALASWIDSQTLPPAYPVDAPLLDVLGDSIAAVAWGWPAMIQDLLRGTYPDLEIYNAAVPGSFSTNLNVQFADAAQFYSASRTRNIELIAIGTNDVAGLVDPNVVAANILARVDASLAAGRRPIVATILPRTAGALGSPAQIAFDAARLTLNNALIAGIGARPGTRVINTAAIVGMGADGDSRNATNYPDGIHPSAAGYTIMAPAYAAEIAAQAA